jgi:uncharacterized protein (TIGR03437 family)
MRVLFLLMILSGTLWAQPSIRTASIYNAGGYQNKLAPDTVAVIFGSNLGPAALVQASAPNYPAELAGTSVTLTPSAGGSAINARMVYTLAGQVACVLPSSVAPGTYAVRVIYNGTASAPQNVTVVARSFGIVAVNSAGSGPAQATIGNVNNGVSLVRFTSGKVSFNGLDWTLSPAHPGDTLVFWGTGGGADSANDTGGTSGDQTAAGKFTVTVGNRVITPFYAGASSGYPGLWQVNFTLPVDIGLDCYAPAIIVAGGETSNVVTVAIAATGQSACSDPNITQDILSKLDAGGSVTGGAFGLVHSDAYSASNALVQTQEFASGAFYKWTVAQWALGAPLRPAPGQCGVLDRVITNGIDPAGPSVGLDAGARLPLTGPSMPAGTGLVRTTNPVYGPQYVLNPSPAPLVNSGLYSVSGNGGADVGAFGVSNPVSSRMPDSFTVTNLNAIGPVDRTKPLVINWSGAGFDHLLIDVNSLVPVSTGVTRSVTITCDAPGVPGTFTIPANLMAFLLPTTNGGIGIYAQPFPALFSADLTAGGKTAFGSFAAERGYSKAFTVQ